MIQKPGLLTSPLGSQHNPVLRDGRMEEEGRKRLRVSLQPVSYDWTQFPKEVTEELRRRIKAASQETTDTRPENNQYVR